MRSLVVICCVLLGAVAGLFVLMGDLGGVLFVLADFLCLLRGIL